MSRRRHHLVERLSEDAQTIVEEGLTQNLPYQTIVDRVRAETEEEIGTSSIGRYFTAKFEPRRKARSQASLIAAELAPRLASLDDQELQRAIKLRTAETLLPMLEELSADDPGSSAKFFAALDFNRVQVAKIEQRQREMEARERLLQAQLQLARDKLTAVQNGAKKALEKPRTKAELQKALKSLYGLSISETPPGGGDSPPLPPGGVTDSKAIPPKEGSASTVRGSAPAASKDSPADNEGAAAVDAPSPPTRSKGGK